MTTTSTLFAGRQIARRLVTLAAFAAASIGASSAHASFFNFDHDQADLVNPRASFVLAAMNWGQTIGGGTVRGALTGQLTYHGALAGCAKVRAVWRNAAGAPVANMDLWRRILDAAKTHPIEWKWVRGHAGDAMNERADRLATEARGK